MKKYFEISPDMDLLVILVREILGFRTDSPYKFRNEWSQVATRVIRDVKDLKEQLQLLNEDDSHYRCVGLFHAHNCAMKYVNLKSVKYT